MQSDRASPPSSMIPAGHDRESWAAWEQYRQRRGGDHVFYWDFLEENPALYDIGAEETESPAAPPSDASPVDWAPIPERVTRALPRTSSGMPEGPGSTCGDGSRELPLAG